jgi:hypothetical protein
LKETGDVIYRVKYPVSLDYLTLKVHKIFSFRTSVNTSEQNDYSR